jgi:hypothetical protein
MSSYFLPLSPGEGNDVFLATDQTIGPWSEKHQHGGPPCALLGRGIERECGASHSVARITFELERPVPVGLVRVAVRTVSGRKARRVEAMLTDEDDRVLVRATAVCIEARALDLPRVPEPPPPPPPPETAPRFEFPFFRTEVGYHTSVDVRLVRGELGSGVVTAYMRPMVPLVDGEEGSPLERLLAVVDSASGVSQALDVGTFTFLNPDLTVALARPPQGEWFALEARTAPDASGMGLCHAAIFDGMGALGHSLQTLVLDRRA